MGDPPPAPWSLWVPCFPSTLQWGKAGAMAFPIRVGIREAAAWPCHKSMHLLKPEQDPEHHVGGAGNTSLL